MNFSQATIARIWHDRHVHGFLEHSRRGKWPKHRFVPGGQRGSNANESNDRHSDHNHSNDITGDQRAQDSRSWTEYHQKRVSTHCAEAGRSGGQHFQQPWQPETQAEADHESHRGYQEVGLTFSAISIKYSLASLIFKRMHNVTSEFLSYVLWFSSRGRPAHVAAHCDDGQTKFDSSNLYFQRDLKNS